MKIIQQENVSIQCNYINIAKLKRSVRERTHFTSITKNASCVFTRG